MQVRKSFYTIHPGHAFLSCLNFPEEAWANRRDRWSKVLCDLETKIFTGYASIRLVISLGCKIEIL